MPGDHRDQLAPFRPLITSIRWGTLAVGSALVATGGRTRTNVALGLVLGVYALGRSFWPLKYRSSAKRDVVAVLAEVALTGGVAVCTGSWTSPYFFCLITAVVATGFTSGSTFSIATGAVATLAVAVPFHLWSDGADVRYTVLGGSELLLVAMVSGYARRLFGEAEARATRALDRIDRLTEANQLLHQLHRVAQRLPASLDLTEVVSSTALRIQELFAPDVVAVLLSGPTDSEWTVGTVKGVRLGSSVAVSDLPVAAHDAIARRRPATAAVGIAPPTRSALYIPLVARDALVGLVAIESSEPGRFGPAQADLAEALGEQVALAVDNARWFSRLRTVGADEERTRIARDLHDRLGQSLAYLAFELDRLARTAGDHPVRGDLLTLRQDVRKVVSEMRDTLYDLRTDVSESQDLVATADAYLRRVAARAGVEVKLDAERRGRLPLPQERELWRIAQEAVTNAERHAQSRSITVRWRCDGTQAELEVADDGIGITGVRARPDAFGLLGMRERAEAIGAHLDVDSAPGAGTRVRCVLAGSPS
jgi:signal transduction histidine kinase